MKHASLFWTYIAQVRKSRLLHVDHVALTILYLRWVVGMFCGICLFCLFCLKRPYCHLSYCVSESVVHVVLTLPAETCFKLIVVMTGRSTSMMP